MAKQPLATLLTDFGTRDPYVAAMKGVILGMCHSARIVDLCHHVPPQDVLAAAFILAQAAPYYPTGTLHVVVVDPTVGTDRRILAARFGGQNFLFPDNGVITFISRRMPLEALAVVSNTKYLPAATASMTFHGRDVFAPVAGHILNGLQLTRLGPQPKSYEMLDLPEPQEQEAEIVGQVIYVDRFGNLVSNIPASMIERTFENLASPSVLCAGRDVGGLQGSYAFVPKGRPLALFNSMGLLEVAVNRGRADETLNAGIGAEIRMVKRK